MAGGIKALEDGLTHAALEELGYTHEPMGTTNATPTLIDRGNMTSKEYIAKRLQETGLVFQAEPAVDDAADAA
jgi:hypothetical protein